MKGDSTELYNRVGRKKNIFFQAADSNDGYKLYLPESNKPSKF